MPIDSQHLGEELDSVTDREDPFVGSIGSVSRQNSIPFWLDRSWIPAGSEYPTDDEDGRGIFGVGHSTPRVLVYDWAEKALNIKPLDTYKYSNSSGDERLLFSRIPLHPWTKPLKLCIERLPKGTSQCAPRYRVTDSKEIPSDMVLLSIIPLDELDMGNQIGHTLAANKMDLYPEFPQDLRHKSYPQEKLGSGPVKWTSSPGHNSARQSRVLKLHRTTCIDCMNRPRRPDHLQALMNFLSWRKALLSEYVL